MTTEALATVYVDQYYASYGNNQTQSAADLGADYAALRTAVDDFAAALLANGAANAAGIQAARSAVQDFDFDYYIDLYDFASRVSANVANTAIDNAAAAVMAALGPATIHEHHGASWPGAHGISIYFPKTLGEYDARYDGSSGFLQFTAAHAVGRVAARLLRLRDGAPANDDFDSAIVIGAVPYTNTQDVAGATTAGDDPGIPLLLRTARGTARLVPLHPRDVPSRSPSTPSAATTTPCSAVWTGSRGSLTNVACSDDAVGLQSRVQFTPHWRAHLLHRGRQLQPSPRPPTPSP